MTHEVSPEFVSGFVTGEGCFYAESGYDPKYKLKHRIRLAFSVELKSDDRTILEEIKNQLGCGNIYNLDFGRYKGYQEKNWKPHVKLRVSNFNEINNKVIPFFKRYHLYGVKQEAFQVFCEIAKTIQLKEHLDSQKLEKVKTLVNKLKTLNKKGL